MFLNATHFFRAAIMLIVFCGISMAASARKLSLNKPYPYTKYSTITFMPGDTCIIRDVLNTVSVLRWRYSNDTIIISSNYQRKRIRDVSYEVHNKDMSNILFHINHPSRLAVIHLLDEEMKEIKNVVLAFSNEVKFDPRYHYFSVQLHEGKSKPSPLKKLKGGGVVKIFIDYPATPDKYPYELEEKFVFSRRKLTKVR